MKVQESEAVSRSEVCGFRGGLVKGWAKADALNAPVRIQYSLFVSSKTAIYKTVTVHLLFYTNLLFIKLRYYLSLPSNLTVQSYFDRNRFNCNTIQ